MGTGRFGPGIASAALLLAAPAAGQDGGDDPVPAEIPTSAFASRAALNGAQLSPDGSRFAFTTKQNDNTYLVIYDADTRERTGGLNLGGEQDFNWFRWAGNGRLLFSMTGRDSRDRYSYSRLYTYDLASSAFHPLASRSMVYDGDNIVHIDPAGEFVLVSWVDRGDFTPTVYRFDLGTQGPPEAQLEQSAQRNVYGWVADNTGTLRIAIGTGLTRQIRMRYRADASGSFDTVARAAYDDDDALELWDFMGLRAGNDTGYSIVTPEGGERRVLIEYDFAAGEPGEVVFSSPDEDVSSVYFDDENNPMAVGYAGDSFRREWLDPEVAALDRQLDAALPGSRVSIIDITPDKSRMLVVQSSPNDPGALYVFTPGERRLDLFAEYRPRVPAALLAQPQAVQYEARDGTTINGYLTLPRGRAAQDLPLIVYPHGGPYGVRDNDYYDDMVQLLANRGYAVIQPNYRGSGGYGESFELLGHGQIGRAMQDDLDDGVAWLASEGTIDPSRVCILGSSYGGFAAVWGAIRNPEIYRCAASFAGVMHFERQLAHDGNYLYGRRRGRHWDRVDGEQSNFDLDDVSPAVQVGRLTRPVLLGHGQEDNRVPYDQYELMVDRARSAGVELETLSLEESAHGFSGPEEEQAWYDAVVDFLARHNPAD